MTGKITKGIIVVSYCDTDICYECVRFRIWLVEPSDSNLVNYILLNQVIADSV